MVAGVSQGHGGAGVLELAGQHSSVELVKLHQVDQVGEFVAPSSRLKNT